MTIVAMRADNDDWRQDKASVNGKFATLLEYGILASAPQPFDPMEKAFHALGAERLPADSQPHSGRTLKWEYGLRPDLLAVTHAYEQTGSPQLVIATKGAPEAIAELCHLPDRDGTELRRAVDQMAQKGMRVLAVARASIPAGIARPDTPHEFPFELLGLVGLADPLRPTVPAAVQECRAAGMRVIMITGDYPQTARAIAAQANLEAGDIVTGTALEGMSDTHLQERVRLATIFARTMPEQKLRIVNALKANGEVVAMTGDGVNDAPSLKAAHIGIAMGGRGTDVAREAASLILLDDDFTSIVAAVRLGRRIYDNLRKAMAYILAVHVPIAGLALIPLLFGLPLVFWPLHIAFLEMIIDPVCSIVFEAEGEEADTMRRPPRSPSAPLFTAGFAAWSVFQGALVLALVAGLFVMALRQNLPEPDARSLAFAALVATNLGLVLVNRSLSASVFAAFTRPNAALWWVVATTAAILAGVILFSPARELFHFGPLHGDDVVVALAAGLLALLLLEVAKRLVQPFQLIPSSGLSSDEPIAVQRES
jgi:Ca2+-transporting ATPase